MARPEVGLPADTQKDIVRVITDSGSDLPAETAAEFDIDVVPLTIRFGNEAFVDGQDISTSEFWKRLQDAAVLPETSAPSPLQFSEAFERAADAGAQGIVCITLSSTLSPGTHNAASSAAKAFGEKLPVRIVDSRAVSLGQGLIAITAAQLAREGKTLEECATAAEELVSRTRIYAALDTMENLKKGGRVGAAKALVGSVLSIKPILEIADGGVEPKGKVRTRRKSLEYLVDLVREAGEIENLAVVHAEAPDYEVLIELLREVHPRGNIIVGNIGPTIGTHAGPRAIGVTFQLRPVLS